MYWRAGRNGIVDLSFMEKESLLGSFKFALDGFEYYIGGVFKFLSDRIEGKNESQYVERFDWRERHGASASSSPYYNGNPSPYYDEVKPGTGWITEVWYQPCSICAAYGSIGALEARSNLFYNHHYLSPLPTYKHVDLNLSEWDVTICNGYACNNSPTISGTLSYIRTTGVVDENCLPYPKNCPEKCDEFEREELVKIEGYDTINITSVNEDWMKKLLIMNGPLVCTVKPGTLGSSQTINHAMALVGFKPIYESDIVYSNPTNPNDQIIIDPESPLIGASSWIFKNS